MPNVDLEDMIHMVHGELAIALASTRTFYDAPMIEVSSIRVRMGQLPGSQDQTGLQLDTGLYPLAEDGWQLEVIYDAKKQANQKELKQITHSGTPSLNAYGYLSKLPIRDLKLSSSNIYQALAKSGIKTLAHLTQLSPQQLSTIKGIPVASLRFIQTTARLVLSEPNTFVPDELLKLTLNQFLDQFPRLKEEDYSYFAWNNLEVIFEWVQQLELCLDPGLIKRLTFKKLLAE